MLVHTVGRILVKVDKRWHMGHTFSNGTELRIEKDVENLDHAYTQPTYGLCISGENIPEQALILFHFNAAHPINEIFNHSQLSGTEIASDIHIYSIPEAQCFLWRKEGETEWHPIGNYALALKVFKPYKGVLENIAPTEIKDVLYVITGDYAGSVFHVVKAAAFRLIFRDPGTGKDEEYIRIRPDGDEKNQREPELIALNHSLTKQVLNNELLIGIDIKSAKILNP